MIKVAYLDVSDLDLSKAYELLPKIRKDKVDRFKFDKDKKLSAGAYLLLDTMLEDENITRPDFKIGKYGKPYISNHEDTHFNISHSGKMVLCAISDREIGADVEYIDREIDLNIAKHYFYHSEYENIMKAKNSADEFFNYWVLKESYMKYTGLGMNLRLDSFEIMIEDEIKLKNDSKNLKFNLFDIKNYKIGITGHYDVSELIKLNISELY